MPFIPFGPLTDLPPGSSRQVEHDEKVLVLCNHDGAVRALDGLCPHRNGPLGQGAFSGGRIVCPWHAWEFDCRTGAHDFNPNLRLHTYPVELRQDGIYVDWDEPRHA